jgi:lipopolysaccharide biosynthesis protein
MIGRRFFLEIKYSRPWHFGHACLGHLRRLFPTVRRTWAGGDPCRTSNDHAVYAHYDSEGVIHDYVVEQLRQLAIAGFRVTFVTNSRRMSEEAISTVRPFCREMIWRRSVGYDFGAYKDGIAALGDLSACDRLLLMNDSIYGPLMPLREVLNAANPAACDFWGITDSWERHYHVQTYFVLFFKRALTSPVFQKFWRRMPYVNSKSWVIRHGEMKLSQRLTRHRLNAAVLCPYWDVAEKVLATLESTPRGEMTVAHRAFLDHLHSNLQFGRPLNSTHYFWDALIADFGAPFIKRELIRLNPQGIVHAWRWPEVIARHCQYDVSLIRRHLQAT